MTAAENTAVTAPPKRPRGKQRATRIGFVTSAGRDKTIRVEIEYLVRHAKYGKYIRRRTRLHAHDEKNECIPGDKVEIMQTRPISKTKSWRLVRILHAAPRAEKAGEA
jgi:small subunit ribosomal protein S17